MTKTICLLSSVMILVFALLNLNRNAYGKVYVDIDSPTFNPIPVAISDFNPKAGGPATQADVSGIIAEGVRQDLSLTGLFNILQKKSFLEQNPGIEKIRFADWMAIGADYLLKGEIVKNDREVISNAYFYEVSRGERVFGRKYRAGAGEVKAISRAIAKDIMLALFNDAGDFNTHIAFVPKKGLKSDIYSISYDGSEIRKRTSHQSILLAPRWSPDGRLLAFTSFRRGRPEIYIQNLQNGLEQKVTSFDGMNLCGSFSPDNRKLLLTLSKDGNNEIYVLDIASLSLKRLTNNYAIDVSPSWSPDGKKIAFVSNRSGSPQIYTMDADGGNVKRVTYDGDYNSSPSWSPRGDRLAYEGRVNNKYQIFTIDPDGGNPQQLTSDHTDHESPSWSPSGRQIVYVSHKQGKSTVFIMNANGTNPRQLYETNSKVVMSTWSPRSQ
jgi:TolB protein